MYFYLVLSLKIFNLYHRKTSLSFFRTSGNYSGAIKIKHDFNWRDDEFHLFIILSYFAILKSLTLSCSVVFIKLCGCYKCVFALVAEIV